MLKIKPRTLLRLWNYWPPFLFTGIKIIKVSKDLLHLKVILKLRFWNANYHGTQYGGAMSAATDPFYAMILIHALGKEYVVWDKAATIRFLKPGKSDLILDFVITPQEIATIKNTIDIEGKMDLTKRIDLVDKDGAVVAYADRTITIKKAKSPNENR